MSTTTRGRLAKPVPDGRDRRRRGQGAPVHHPELTRLDLPTLRAYRQQLVDEETRVSYWRRLVQARLAVLAPAAGPAHTAARSLTAVADGNVDLDADDVPLRRLPQLVSEDTTARRRRSLLQVAGRDDRRELLDLPAVAALATLDAVGSPAAEEPWQLLLQAAEQELSDLRQVLGELLDAATEDLVYRYAAAPQACLAALPVDPRARRSA